MVLRAGGEYKTAHVLALLAGVERYWPYVAMPLRVVVVTNDDDATALAVEHRRLLYPWSGWWSKLALFSPDLDDLGDLLYFDLDTVVVGSLEDVAAAGCLTLLQDFYRPAALGSGLMYLPLECRAAVWAKWLEGPSGFIRRYRGDQDFLADALRGVAVECWQALLPGQVVSYKVAVQPRRQIPADVRVICFHGQPRPWSTPDWFARAVQERRQ